MNKIISTQFLIELGLSTEIADKVNYYSANNASDMAWQAISQTLLTSQHPFSTHLSIFSLLFPTWKEHPETAPAWIPQDHFIKTTNLAQCIAEQQLTSLTDFHAWTTHHISDFWQLMLEKLDISFSCPPNQICDLTPALEHPKWLPGAKMNIVASCFNASMNTPAIITQNPNGELTNFSYQQLDELSNSIAHSLRKQQITAGDPIAIIMPMTLKAVALFLGIIKMGGIAVPIPDSFSPEEIATRLRIANVKILFTQDIVVRKNKLLQLYAKITTLPAPPIVVLTNDHSAQLRDQDLSWDHFLISNHTFEPHPTDPMSPCIILFSSGTSGDPKAIPWNHTTAIKAASDAYLHHNIQPGDILSWSTNLGWMMGPWLVFASLINKAAIAIYDDIPHEAAYGKFIQDAKVTMLGVVPTLVAGWRQTNCMYGLDWSHIKVFSSTGECSNPDDMLYLMSLANYKPIIEYCGGTEIGGAYVSSTVIQKNYPSLFTTPAMGISFVLLDETGNPSEQGDVALIPPSIGLSTELLNGNHHKVYYENMPLSPQGQILRRHGDQLRRFANGTYSILGRSDDAMNLGGIKVSAAEIERALTGIHQISETAAIAVSSSSQGGPSRLIIFAVTQDTLDKSTIQPLMQKAINQHLNPLFKIHDIIFVSELPRTASNKILRRVLRKRYETEKLP